ncbi:hypothetical protein UA45_14150 [Morganella morganii]|uniref:Uncharacterized protein n=1 Tax=Morganella morganii TaxID=582 RepID=A0A0D8L630_MORMO|nr:hypothetical protein UA45_14150 [Morganella morganii]
MLSLYLFKTKIKSRFYSINIRHCYFYKGMSMNNFDEISGQYCSFKSPLNEGEFFAIQAGFVMPEGVKPVIDGSAGLCIGYLYGMGDIYHIYDINGYSQGVCTLAPESALSEPLDLLLVSGIVAEPDGRISLLMRYGSTRSVSSGSTLRDMPVIQALKNSIIQHNTKKSDIRHWRSVLWQSVIVMCRLIFWTGRLRRAGGLN